MREESVKTAAQCSNIPELLRWRALQQPDRQAYVFLHDGEKESAHLTYAELDRKARAIGALLECSTAAGKRALLLYPSGLEFVTAFLGCLYAGIIAVPAFLPRLTTEPNYRMLNLQAITESASPDLALTTSQVLSKSQGFLQENGKLQSLSWLPTDNVADHLAEDWREPEMRSNHLAFLQYTSGSTAQPKGVMVSHSNIMANQRMIEQAWRHTSESTSVSWIPHYHDMGLIASLLQSLYIGAKSILMPPLAFVQKPLRWLQAMSHYKAHTSGAPNFAYDLCIQRIAPEQRVNLDLSCWEVAFNGSEPIRVETLERFADTFAPCGFRREALEPGYGLAEATVMVSSGRKADSPFSYSVEEKALQANRIVPSSNQEDGCRTVVNCGRSWLEEEIAIVDPESLTRCAPDQVGEIWVSGPNVAIGYWDRPEATEQTFRAYIADTGEGPFLRTGDLGFIKYDGLFVTGRIKDLIIIDGRNHYPQDIEFTVEQSHPALQRGCCAAFSVDSGSPERLIVAAEIARRYQLHPELDRQEIVRAIRCAIAEEHDVRVAEVMLLKSGGVPKTSSGKIQRSACRAAFLKRELKMIEPDGYRHAKP